MRYVSIDLLKCRNNNITPNEFIYLFLSNHKNYNEIDRLFDEQQKRNISKVLVFRKLALDTQGRLLTDKGKQLINAKDSDINFDEFYREYPLKAGSRRLKAAEVDTKFYKDMRHKYLGTVKTKEEHDRAIQALKNMVDEHRITSRLQYLPGLEVVINGKKWEMYMDNSVQNNSSSYGQTVE